MIFRQLFDRESCTYSYLLGDRETREAVLIDPVVDQLERDAQLLHELDLILKYTLDTHVHADHVTGAARLRSRLGSQTVLSRAGNASGVDLAVEHGDSLEFGRYHLEVRATPGHTASCVSYYLPDGGMVFTGDALFIRGCGRADFQQGDAESLYRSVHEQLFSLPDATLVYPGHDYAGRTVSTVGEERAFNPRLGAGRGLAEFIQLMSALDLPRPQKIDVALPANQNCGLESSL